MYYYKNNAVIQSDLKLDLPEATAADWDKQNAPTIADIRREAYPSVE